MGKNNPELHHFTQDTFQNVIRISFDIIKLFINYNEIIVNVAERHTPRLIVVISLMFFISPFISLLLLFRHL
jgi:hypothetical protein